MAGGRWLRYFAAAGVILTAASAIMATGPGALHRHPDFATGTRRPNRPTIAPTVPGADRGQSDKVFLEHADTLRFSENNIPDPITGQIPRPVSGARGQCGVSQGGNDHDLRQCYFYEAHQLV